MPSPITIDTNLLEFDTADGKLLCVGSALDLHYAYADIVDTTPQGSHKERFTKYAEVLLSDFRSEARDYTDTITWAVAAKIAASVQAHLAEQKKTTED